jgi:hypothetical protein
VQQLDEHYNYSSHYGVSRIPAHLQDSIVDTQAPRFFLPAAEGVTVQPTNDNTAQETAA